MRVRKSSGYMCLNPNLKCRAPLWPFLFPAQAAHELQKSGHEAFVLDDLDFGRWVQSETSQQNIAFYDSYLHYSIALTGWAVGLGSAAALVRLTLLREWWVQTVSSMLGLTPS